MTLLLAGCLLVLHFSILAAGSSAAICPAIRIKTRKTVVANSEMLVRIKMQNPNPKQPLGGVALTVRLPPDVLYVRSSSRKAKQTAPSQDGQVLSWSNLYLKRALSFSIQVNVTEGAYNTLGRPIVFHAQSSMATPCTSAAAPKSVAVKPPRKAKKGPWATKNPTSFSSSSTTSESTSSSYLGMGAPPRAQPPRLSTPSPTRG